MPTRRLFLALAPALIAAPATAHHGWGSYEAQNPQTLTGEIERVEFVNPHATIWLKTPGKTWEVVLAPPFRMTSRGVAADRLRAGMTVTVMGYPHRQKENELRAEWIRIGEMVTQLR
ncbi:hypothetical protein FK498_04005 [Elioraea sp. Yellowstone]|jgi:hypothetical protein|uniref:DUF6152 family protein n=1 Tax=Elioraea sp. Yellowstone TaxID=2592070 RepID=UPI00115424AA|nr:DUF6152 family protein [Elioraea sp. Yellowstone]TQF82529.1 hypothetical protein FK498_04005 [Elioraea sp. Yellowstone]